MQRQTKLINSVCVVLALVVIGSLLVRVQATSFSASQEAEAGSPVGQARVCSDSTASGGSSIRFGTTGCRSNDSRFTNPVKVDTADPGVIRWNNKYYMVTTSGDPYFDIHVSDDLVSWQFTQRTVFNGLGTHPWGSNKFWAPELHRAGDRFAVYYSAADKNDGRLSVGVAFADDILGPYTDLGRPLVRESFGVIDVNFFRDDDGRQYLYWKEDGGNTRIFAQEVDRAGSGFVGQRKVVLQKGLAWEGSKGIEGTWLTKNNGVYYMFYSGELFSSSLYSVGVARSNGPLETFSKKGNPILRSSNRWKGPGHNTVAQVGSTDYMIYHAWDRTPGAGNRVGLVDKITWTNGWPAVGNGFPSEAAQPYPQ